MDELENNVNAESESDKEEATNATSTTQTTEEYENKEEQTQTQDTAAEEKPTRKKPGPKPGYKRKKAEEAEAANATTATAETSAETATVEPEPEPEPKKWADNPADTDDDIPEIQIPNTQPIKVYFHRPVRVYRRPNNNSIITPLTGEIDLIRNTGTGFIEVSCIIPDQGRKSAYISYSSVGKHVADKLPK